MNKTELVNLHKLLEVIVQESQKDKYEGSIDIDLNNRDVVSTDIHKSVNAQEDALLSLAQKIQKEVEGMDLDQDDVTEDQVKQTSQQVIELSKDKDIKL